MLKTNLDTFLTKYILSFIPLNGSYANKQFCTWNNLIGSAPAHPILTKTNKWMVNHSSKQICMTWNNQFAIPWGRTWVWRIGSSITADTYDMEQSICHLVGKNVGIENWKIWAEDHVLWVWQSIRLSRGAVGKFGTCFETKFSQSDKFQQDYGLLQ